MRPLISCIVATLAFASLSHGQSVSSTSRCGADFGGLVCTGSSFGNCCSKYNYCGTTLGHCGSGCQSKYGTCKSSASIPVTTVSKDGSCGGTKGYTCLNSIYGNCCSQYGYCGTTSAYCGKGCNSKFGSCSSAVSSYSAKSSTASTFRSSSAAGSTVQISSASTTYTSTRTSSALPISTGKLTTDARCGNDFGTTCQGSRWGNCCSEYSYCGSSNAYCGTGCQKRFGSCNADSYSTLSSRPSTPVSSVMSSSKTSSSSLVSTSSVSKGSVVSSSTSVASDTSTALSVSATSSALTMSTASSVSSLQSFSSAYSSTSVLSSPSSSSSSVPSSTLSDSSSSILSSTAPSTPSTSTSFPTASVSSIATVSVSSTASSSAVIPSSSTCPTTANFVVNPSFENGDSMNPWTESVRGSYIGRVAESGGHNSPQFLRVETDDGDDLGNTYRLTQSGIAIPQGSTILPSIWVQTSTPLIRVELYFDRVLLASEEGINLGLNAWFQLKARNEIQISENSLHTIGVTLINAAAQASFTVGIDDFDLGLWCASTVPRQKF